MRVVWRRHSPGAFDYELVWLTVSVLAAASGLLWLHFAMPWPSCPFLAVTGYPCLTCGATRCAIALAHGNFSAAWLWNPLALVALCTVALFDVYAAIVLIARVPRLRLVDWTATEKNAVRIGAVVFVAANWIYLLAHHTQY